MSKLYTTRYILTRFLIMSVYYWLLQSVHRYFGHEVLVGFCPVGMFGSMLVPKVCFLAFSDRQQLHVFRPSGHLGQLSGFLFNLHSDSTQAQGLTSWTLEVRGQRLKQRILTSGKLSWIHPWCKMALIMNLMSKRYTDMISSFLFSLRSPQKIFTVEVKGGSPHVWNRISQECIEGVSSEFKRNVRIHS